MMGHCADCRHRDPDAAHVEQMVAGLTVFGSAFGASIGDSRLCHLHDCLVSRVDTCRAFQAHPAAATQP